jgi:aspartyl-tRNA(Asn)/glutamyl-tRNA(Gln) amidotransferase subunit B
MRIEPNISVMHRDDTSYRTRTEVKNLNSIRSLFRAIEYETARHIKAWESGEGVRQATMGWDEAKQRTVVQRYKESAEEYRYFPEPDLPIVEVSREWVAEIRASLPELPDAKAERFMTELGLSRYDASVLVAERAIADFYDTALAAGANPKSLANWMLGQLFSLFNARGVAREDIATTKIGAAQFAALVKLVDGGTINKATGVTVLEEMFDTGADPQAIVDAKGLAQISDTSAIEAAVDQMLAENPAWLAEYLGGKDKLFGPMMGKVMGILKGQGNPAVVREVMAKMLDARRE